MNLIIGHTSGIGVAICDKLSADGISRSNGYTINDHNMLNYDFSLYDTIVLNAYDKFTSQLNCIYDIIENPSFTKDKLLVVISSIKAFNNNPSDLSRSKYSVEKYAINKVCRDLNILEYKVSSICLGMCDTTWNDKNVCIKLNVDDVANRIYDISHLYHTKGILIENEAITQRC